MDRTSSGSDDVVDGIEDDIEDELDLGLEQDLGDDSDGHEAPDPDENDVDRDRPEPVDVDPTANDPSEPSTDGDPIESSEEVTESWGGTQVAGPLSGAPMGTGAPGNATTDGRVEVRRLQDNAAAALRRGSQRLSRIFPHPLVAVGVAILTGGAVYEFSARESPQLQPSPPPRVMTGGFAAPDFRRADKGAITERQAAATLASARQHADRDPGHVVAQCDSTPPGAAGPPVGDAPSRAHATMPPVAQVPSTTKGDVPATTPKRPRSHNRRAGRGRVAAKIEATEDGKGSQAVPAYLVGFRSNASEEVREPPTIDLPVGTRIQAVVDIGISSAKHGTAVARTSSEVLDARGRKVPAGSVLTGRSSSSYDRVYLDFTAIRVGTETFRVRAVGTENEDLGLQAERIEAPMGERTSARFADGALGAARGLAAAGGGVLGRVVSQATGGVINEAQREQRVDRTATLKVAAGTAFTVVVTE